MPFVALDKNGIRKCSLDLTPDQYRQPWFCQLCKTEMMFVDAQLRRKHFRHHVDHGCEFEAESKEHLEMKKELFEKFFRYLFRWNFLSHFS